MAKLLDESWDKVDPVQAERVGFVDVIGYVSEDNTHKNLTAADVHAIHSAGMSVTLVYEYLPNAAAYGAPRGRRDAGIAAWYMSQLQAPHGIAVYASLDQPFTADQMPAVSDYVSWFARTVADAGYRHGVYGGYDQLSWLHDHGYDGLYFQTSGWSRGLWLPYAAIRQTAYGVHVAGGVVDLDDSTVGDWGQWNPPAPRPPLTNGDTLVNHWHTVQYGSKGQAVMVAQGLLLAHGFGVGSRDGRPDGDFGPTTLASTKALQSRYGIAVDGVFGPHTASVGLYGVDVA